MRQQRSKRGADLHSPSFIAATKVSTGRANAFRGGGEPVELRSSSGSRRGTEATAGVWHSGHLLRQFPTRDCGTGAVPIVTAMRSLWLGFLSV